MLDPFFRFVRVATLGCSVTLAMACVDDPAGDEVESGGAGGSSVVGASGPGATTGSISAGGSGDAVTSATTTSGTGGAGEGVPVIIAQGQLGRTMVSCDDGASWIHDRSDEPALRCDPLDCDHHVGSAMGLVIRDGVAVMSSGWGTPGRVRRSVDGVTWDVALDLDFPFASLSADDGVLMGAAPRPKISNDFGATWEDVPRVYIAPPLRQSLFIPYGAGRFVLISEGNGLRAFRSDDHGQTFASSANLPAGCLAISMRFGNGVLVMNHGSNGVCRSTDGGETWSVTSIGGEIGIYALDFVDDRFVALGEGVLHESADGQAWTHTPTDLAAAVWNMTLGHNDATGALVAVTSAYEQQRFYRSPNGTNWTTVDAPTGHPIRRFASGRLAASACP